MLFLSKLIPDNFVVSTKQFTFAAYKIDKNESIEIKYFEIYGQKRWLYGIYVVVLFHVYAIAFFWWMTLNRRQTNLSI